MANMQKIRANFRKENLAISSTEYYDLDAKDLVDDNGQQVPDLVPFRNATIYNDGTTLLKVYANGRRGYDPIPAGTIFEISDDRISAIKIINSSSTNTADYYLTLDGEESTNSLLKGILGFFLKRGLFR